MTIPNLFDLPQGFQDKIMPEPMSGCWLWIGSLTPDGYGRKRLNRSTVSRVHRDVFTILVREIPVGMQLDHTCRVRSCCNPSHLEVVSKQENQQRGDRNQYSSKAKCPYGHSYSGDNLIIRFRNGKRQRYCRTCKNESMRRWHIRQGNVRGDVAAAGKMRRSYSHGKWTQQLGRTPAWQRHT